MCVFINNSINLKSCELKHIDEYLYLPSTPFLLEWYLKYPFWILTSLSPRDPLQDTKVGIGSRPVQQEHPSHRYCSG